MHGKHGVIDGARKVDCVGCNCGTCTAGHSRRRGASPGTHEALELSRVASRSRVRGARDARLALGDGAEDDFQAPVPDAPSAVAG